MTVNEALILVDLIGQSVKYVLTKHDTNDTYYLMFKLGTLYSGEIKDLIKHFDKSLSIQEGGVIQISGLTV